MIIKEKSAIEKLVLNGATFENQSVEPTLINFFYGNNGTGKSTIARIIDPHDTEFGADFDFTWQRGKTAGDYSLLIYNDRFVKRNFQDYGNLKGVYTIGEEGAAKQKEVALKTAERAEQDRINSEKNTEKGTKETEREGFFTEFQKSCWDKTKAIREGFDATQEGFKRPISKFANKVLEGVNPQEHDLGELGSLYEIAYAKSVETYQEFQATSDISKLRGGNELLAQSITSSSNTDFAKFIKALNATDWVRQGHERYTEAADGCCPYCQQELPENFDEQIASCFDKQYQEDIAALRQFHTDYVSVMRGLIQVLNANLQNPYPKLELDGYKSTLALLEKTIEANISLIDSKLKEPSIEVTLESVKALRENLKEMIDGFNEQIRANNALSDPKAKRQMQNEVTEKVWQHIYFVCQADVTAYKTKKKKADGEITALMQLIESGKKASRDLSDNITELNKQIASIAPTIDKINILLRDSGFQGFWLREKTGHVGAYEIVRKGDVVASGLSEGERNFIAFLYFYHLVKGGHEEKEINNDKIVVIDDPVSSMDSGALFIVSTLVREMVNICCNNLDTFGSQVEGDYIKQIFILTHNVYFHREVTYNQVKHFDRVSFYMVNKADNISTIRLCTRYSKDAAATLENYNPVQNSYAALWREFKEVDTSLSMMNVVRRILEYYFMQLCGYDGVDIRKRVLDEQKEKFYEFDEDGKLVGTDRYNLASSMLAYINATSIGVSDGLNYVEDFTDVEIYRNVLKLIFETMSQEQHYNMMMSA